MTNKFIYYLLIAVVPCIALTNPVRAEQSRPDKFRLAITSYTVEKSDSTISVTEPNLGAGISLSPRDTLGLSLENTVLRIDGYYRFNSNHGLSYSWFNIDTSGEKSLEDTIEWTDRDGNRIVIPVGAQVVSSMEIETFKLGYFWSFYNSGKLEMALGAGLHVTELSLGLDASVTLPPNSSIQNVDTTLPLPVVSLAIRYNVTPAFQWNLKAETFALEFDNWYGSFTEVTFGVEYRAWKHVALGAAITRNSLEIEEDDPDYFLKYENRISGGMLYVATYF